MQFHGDSAHDVGLSIDEIDFAPFKNFRDKCMWADVVGKSPLVRHTVRLQKAWLREQVSGFGNN